jgi:NADH-quinone oxidoreductase subunit G
MSYRSLQGEGRLTHPLVRGEDEFVPSTWASALSATAGRLTDLARARPSGAIGVLVSARASNEEIFLLRRLATVLGARIAGMSWSPPGADHDDFLIRADKNPNSRGLVLQGLAPDGAAGELVAAAATGDLAALVLHRVDLTAWCEADLARRALECVPCLIVLDSEQRETVEYADVILPLGTHVESDGTFTNFAARVQRFWAAVPAPGEARPGWQVLAELLAHIGGEGAAAHAEDVFASLAAEFAAFGGMTYASLGEAGASAAAAPG